MGIKEKLFGKKKEEKPQSRPMKTMGASCPECGTTMKMTEVEGETVNLCFGCGHFSIRRENFEDLLDVKIDTEKDPHPATEGKGLDCPACRKEMMVVDINDDEFSFCPKCDKIYTSRDSIIHTCGIDRKPEDAGHNADKKVMGFIFKMDKERNIELARQGKQVPGLMAGSVFVIYNNGLLITSYTKDEEGIDEDILGGMIVAVTDFVRTSFSSFAEGEYLSSIRFKEKEIAFEQGKYLILALEMDGVLDENARKSLREKLAQIENNYDGILSCWKGNVEEMADLTTAFGDLLVPLKQ